MLVGTDGTAETLSHNLKPFCQVPDGIMFFSAISFTKTLQSRNLTDLSYETLKKNDTVISAVDPDINTRSLPESWNFVPLFKKPISCGHLSLPLMLMSQAIISGPGETGRSPI
jgi:hypothetical protein